jgi:bacillithiol system protein YtxJ
MIKTLKNVDELLKISEKERILILKHSNTCGISRHARSEVDSFLSKNNTQDVYLVVVQENRSVSNELADKLDVKHESPQFLVVRNKKAESVLNHFDVTSDNIEKSLRA